MKLRKVPNPCLLNAILALAMYQMTLYFPRPVWADQDAASRSVALPGYNNMAAKDVLAGPDRPSTAKPNNRTDSVRALIGHLGLGEGSAVADIGAGNGRDTWVFAEIVRETGTVFAEEIVESNVRSLEKEAKKRNLNQVRAVLGRSDDPCLPANSVDMAFLHYVYHHLAKPREMLQGIWHSLKPGGYLVVVDQRRGTLRDWVPRHLREREHFWIAETTVVREAREEGFAFMACAEQRWHAKDNFVLVFQRPEKLNEPGHDPDPFPPINVEECSRLFVPVSSQYQRPVFIALGQARDLIAPILANSTGEGLEIVLEEWATQKDEREPLPPGVSMPCVLTQQGNPNLPGGPIDAVFFLDSYHLLFHAKTLLAKIYERLVPTGCVYVLDRKADEPLSRREASHYRRIAPRTVSQEMAETGFFLWFRGPRPAHDRYLMVFGKARPEDIPPEDDPFVGGPVIPEPPGLWLRRNCWRLRGFKTTGGKCVTVSRRRWEGSLQKVAGTSPTEQIWKIPKENLVLYFEEKNQEYLLTNFRSGSGQ